MLYKGLEFETVYLEYPDIEPTAKKIGAKPTSSKPDGQPHYTVPMITDSSNGAVISDSYEIAKYLDKTYPSTPKLIPDGTAALQAAFQTLWPSVTGPSVLQLLLPPSCSWLNPPSAEYFRRTREIAYGMKMEEFAPEGSDLRKEHISKMKEAFDKVDSWLANSSGSFFVGDKISYADITVVTILRWIQRFLPEWEEVKTWNNGRWAELVERFKGYEGLV